VGNLASVRLFAVVGDVSRERVAWWKPNLTRICEPAGPELAVVPLGLKFDSTGSD
jgi:hypothetical protein